MIRLLLALALTSSVRSEEVVERRLVIMGTELALRVTAADRSSALAASEAAVRAVEVVERRLSAHRSDSELYRLGHAPAGIWQTVSPELMSDLRQAEWCREATRGAFDLTTNTNGELELGDGRARRTGHARPDAGGLGKGVGLDAALDAARAAGASSVVLDLGGQLAAYGTPLQLDVAHPVRRRRTVASMQLLDGSVATSGQGEQPGHIRDPRTGEAVPAWGSVTVRAPTASVADCLATGLFVLGPSAAVAVAELHDGIDVLVVERRGLGIRRWRSSPGTDRLVAGGAP